MFAAWIMMTSGCRNKFIDCQTAKVRIAVLPCIYVKTQWYSTLELLKRACRLREFTFEGLYNSNYIEYGPQYSTQDEWTIVKDIMQVFRPFHHCTH
jgi:hypothetical protein